MKISNFLFNVKLMLPYFNLTFDELLFAFDKILKNEFYYSESVKKMLSLSEEDSIEIDQFDEQILFHISKGTKTIEMPQYIPISLSAIERRKINLKELPCIKITNILKNIKSKKLL